MRGTTNVAAFKAYLEGERAFSLVNEGSMATSRDKFREATTLDPNFARAWGYLSYSYMRSILVKWLSDSELPAAEEYALKAVELDGNAHPDLPAVDYAPYWDLAFVYLNTDRIPQAVEQYDKAIDLYDNLTDRLDRKPGLLAEAAVAYLRHGNRERAAQLAQKAQLIPGWYRWNNAFVLYMQRDYEGAMVELDHPDLDPGHPQFIAEILLFRAAVQGCMGDVAGGRASIERFLGLRPDTTFEDVLDNWRFTNAADNDFWREGLERVWPK